MHEWNSMVCDIALMIVGAILGTLISVSMNCFFQWWALPFLAILPAESAQRNETMDCVYANILVRNKKPNRFMGLFVQRQPAINVVVKYECYEVDCTNNMKLKLIDNKSRFLARWGSAPETDHATSGMYQFPTIHAGDDDPDGRYQFNVLKIVPDDNTSEQCTIIPCTNETYKCNSNNQGEGFSLKFKNNTRILVKITATSIARSTETNFYLKVDNRFAPKFARHDSPNA